MNPKFRFFELAKRLAKKSDHTDHPLGSVLVQKNRIVSVGFNRYRTHPYSKTRFKTTHAEFDAVFGLDLEVTRGSILYVWRSKKNGTPGMSRPCICCQELIKAAGIKGVFYSIENAPYWRFERY